MSSECLVAHWLAVSPLFMLLVPTMMRCRVLGVVDVVLAHDIADGGNSIASVNKWGTPKWCCGLHSHKGPSSSQQEMLHPILLVQHILPVTVSSTGGT